MGTEIARKLRLTAALVGAVTLKDLADAFRRVNPKTTFDVGRAYKWLQGRARPREHRVYKDWALLVDLEEPAEWIAECGAEAFLERACARRGLARETLLRRAEAFAGAAAAARREAADGRAAGLVSTYVCYSHAWSPYFRGQLVRGILAITAAPGGGPQRLLGTYTEALPTGRLQARGEVTLAERALCLDLRGPQGGGVQLLLCLFPPTPPASVLGGFMTGTTLVGPDPHPSVTRVVMVRLPETTEDPRPDPPGAAYLPPGVSPAADLAALGLPVAAREAMDGVLAAFLSGGAGGGLDQIPGAAYRALVELFDRWWLENSGETVGPALTAHEPRRREGRRPEEPPPKRIRPPRPAPAPGRARPRRARHAEDVAQ